MLKIEEGKYYKTRDGRKVGPAKDTHYRGRFEFEGQWPMLHEADGTYRGRGNKDRALDLVAEWTDGPVVTETVTKTRIVPGTYDGVSVEVPAPYGEFLVSWCKHDPTPDQLDAAAVVLSALAKGLRDA